MQRTTPPIAPNTAAVSSLDASSATMISKRLLAPCSNRDKTQAIVYPTLLNTGMTIEASTGRPSSAAFDNSRRRPARLSRCSRRNLGSASGVSASIIPKYPCTRSTVSPPNSLRRKSVSRSRPSRRGGADASVAPLGCSTTDAGAPGFIGLGFVGLISAAPVWRVEARSCGAPLN